MLSVSEFLKNCDIKTENFKCHKETASSREISESIVNIMSAVMRDYQT